MSIIKKIDLAAQSLREKILKSKTEIEPCGRCYYVSNDGNDLNKGSIDAPWATLEKVSNAEFSKGDAVFFRRGDIFRGNLITQSWVTYSAYGEGEKPVVCGSLENAASSEKWIKVKNTENIWKFYLSKSDIASIFFNDGSEYAVKRCPKIINDKFEFGIEVLEDMQFICLPDPEKAKMLNNSTFRDIKGELYLRCDRGNPGEVFYNIEMSERVYLVTIPYHSESITIDNLAVKYGGTHGIGGGFIKELTVKNCEIAYIGGGLQSYSRSADGNEFTPLRYGNGVELHSYCNGYTVKDCWVHDVYDAGITHQQGTNHSVGLMFKDVSYVGNLIENCEYSIEYFARKSAKNGATVLMENILIEDNIMRNAGSGFSSQRTLIDRDWNMATHINGWFSSTNLTNGNFVIKDNIFDRSLYSSPGRPLKQNTSIILVAADYEGWLPKFSGNTYVCEKGNQFCYKGLCIEKAPIPFVMAEENLLPEKIFGDDTGEIYIL